MRPTTTPSARTSKSSSFHSPDRREAAARLRTSWSMSAPLPGYAESGYTEPKEDRTQNKVIQNPGEACAKEREGGEQGKVARLGVHSRSRLERGSDQAAPPLCAS